MNEFSPRLPWKWIGTFFVALLIAGTLAVIWAGTQPRQSKNFPIAGTLYQWPDHTVIIPPQPPGIYGKGYVRYRSSRSYPDQNAFFLIYDGDHQEPQNEAGLPHLQMITSRFSKPDDHSFKHTPVGMVVCARKGVQLGTAFSCGLSFVIEGPGGSFSSGLIRSQMP